ncbi:hypothetical protein, partial [Streptobacillus moniliformis]|uniref:hypothetical protein n=1 Tax=Streptobacillus moniliformis TaxID=34105 RepID=UPI001E5E7ACB
PVPGTASTTRVRQVEDHPIDEPRHTISVVIPVYQGERTLPDLMAELAVLTSEFRTPGGHLAVVTEVLPVYDNGP